MISLDNFTAENLIQQALVEDIGSGDRTTEILIPPDMELTATFNTREEGIMSGLPLLEKIFKSLHPDVEVETFVQEGDKISAGQKLATVRGNAKAILKGERVSLNFLQRMSAIATMTAKFQEAIEPYKARVCDTRKTCPNFRVFEKYSVSVGGGSLHRFGLFDAVMIKDNHISAAGSITKAVNLAKEKISHVKKIEVETESLEQVQEALDVGADIIMLDNMSVEMMKDAVKMINGRAIIEASGTVTLDNINEVASSGVDYISTSAITVKAGCLDIGLDI